MKKSIGVLILFLSVFCHAEIFQCKNSSGKIEFKDKPCEKNTTATNLTEKFENKTSTSLDAIKEGKTICRPSLSTDMGNFKAGTAFVLDHPLPGAKALLVTAHHIFGPDGGLPKQIAWNDLSRQVSSASCALMAKGIAEIDVYHPYTITDAQSSALPGNKRDIAVFPIKDKPLYAMKLAETAPGIGSTVYLVAELVTDASHSKFMHKATVIGDHNNEMEFVYEESGLNFIATSGAPIVDENGQVVGINVGTKVSATKLTGVAVDLHQISLAIATIK